jgi:hypothetical protein
MPIPTTGIGPVIPPTPAAAPAPAASPPVSSLFVDDPTATGFDDSGSWADGGGFAADIV